METTEAGEAEGCGLSLGFFFGTSLLEALEECVSAVSLPSVRAWAMPWVKRPPSREEGGINPCKESTPARDVTGVSDVAGVVSVVERAAEGIPEPPEGAV